MSRNYRLLLVVEGPLNDEGVEAIDDVVGAEWIQVGFIRDGELYRSQWHGKLGGGESEGKAADRLAAAIWKKLDDFVPLFFYWTNLDAAPCMERGFKHYENLVLGD